MLTVFAFGKMKLQLPILRLYVLNRMSHFVLFKSILLVLVSKLRPGVKKRDLIEI